MTLEEHEALVEALKVMAKEGNHSIYPMHLIDKYDLLVRKRLEANDGITMELQPNPPCKKCGKTVVSRMDELCPACWGLEVDKP